MCYSLADLPWFEYYASDLRALEGGERFGGMKSVAQKGKGKGDVPLPENVAVEPGNVVRLRAGLRKDQVREERSEVRELTAMKRWKYALIIVGTAALAGACAPQSGDSQAGSVADRAASLDADSLLPPLPGYTTDDDAEPGEVEASLDHGSVPYEEVPRRIR